MRKLLLVTLGLLFGAALPLWAAPDGVIRNSVAVCDPNNPTSCLSPTGAGAFTPNGYQQITSLASSTALTIPAGSRVALLSVETAGVRYRDDGVAPTASVGMPIAAAQTLLYTGSLSAVRFIAQSGSPVLNILYYK